MVTEKLANNYEEEQSKGINIRVKLIGMDKKLTANSISFNFQITYNDTSDKAFFIGDDLCYFHARFAVYL